MIEDKFGTETFILFIRQTMSKLRKEFDELLEVERKISHNKTSVFIFELCTCKKAYHLHLIFIFE